MKRPYVLAFVGENANGSLRWGIEKHFPGFGKYGLDCRLIDLLDPGWTTELGNYLSEAKPAFCFSYQGVGTGIHASNSENLWVRLGVPFITHINDNPYHYPRLHCAEGPGIYRLFGSEDFFDCYVRYFQDRTYAAILHPGYPENPYADCTAWKQREHNIVYIKTGVNSRLLRQNWQAFPAGVRGILEETVELALSGVDETVACLCEQVFRSRKIDWGERKEFFFSVCSMADFYIRAFRAERMVSALMRHDALIVGDWSHLDRTNARARFAGPIPAADLDQLYAQSRVAINTLPATRRGMHERIMAGFHARAAVVSDSTPYVDNKLKDYPSFFAVAIDGEGFSDAVDHALTQALDGVEIEEKIRISAAQASQEFSLDGFVQGLMDYVALDRFRLVHDVWRIPPAARQTASRVPAQAAVQARALNNAI